VFFCIGENPTDERTQFEKEAYLLYVLMLFPLRLEINTAEPAVDVLERSSLALLALVLHQAVKRNKPRIAWLAEELAVTLLPLLLGPLLLVV
jgi:hypothetical protein